MILTNGFVLKGSLPSKKKRKRQYNWLQDIDYDPRPMKHRKVHSFETMNTFTNSLDVKVSPPPPVLSLLKKHYLPVPTAESKCTQQRPDVLDRNNGIMTKKLKQFLKQTTLVPTPENFLSCLGFTDEEIQKIDKETIDQWKCKSWFITKKGFISASKCKSCVTRQTTLEKSNETLVTSVAKSIVSDPPPTISKSLQENPQNPRDWGLKHEESAREAYMHVQNHVHYKVRLESHGFIISKDKPFLGASVDNVRSCECVSDCNKVVVEYKCPWTLRHSDAKEAFLSPDIGGVQVEGRFQLKTTSKYYHQVQMQMFVLSLLSCDFVIWTTKGILTVEIPYDAKFMNSVLPKLEKFWTSQIAPLLIIQVSGNVQNQGNILSCIYVLLILL